MISKYVFRSYASDILKNNVYDMIFVRLCESYPKIKYSYLIINGLNKNERFNAKCFVLNLDFCCFIIFTTIFKLMFKFKGILKNFTYTLLKEMCTN